MSENGDGGGPQSSGSPREDGAASQFLSAYAGGKPGALPPPNAFMAGTLPLMPNPMFAQPFMYPAPLFYGGMPALHPAYAAMVGSEGADTRQDDGGSQDEQTDDDEGDTQEETGGAERSERRRGGSESRATTASALGKRRSEAALGVKSQSSAALSLLATAAANKPAQPSAAAAAQQAVMGDVWGTLNGQPVVASAPDLTRMASDAQMQQLLASGQLDEREAKRLRRKQSNRESARRSRLRKQAECEQLARQVKDLLQENSRLKEEVLQLQAQVEILNHKLSMTSALQMSLNQGELDKIQAGLRARQSQEAASMAAAMVQLNAMTNGGASLDTLPGAKSEGAPDSEATSGGGSGRQR